jgi:hypothetical protein
MILSREEIVAKGEAAIARATDPQAKITFAPDLERAPEPEAPEVLAFRQVLATGTAFAVATSATGTIICPMAQTVFGFPGSLNSQADVDDANPLVIRLAFSWDDLFPHPGVVRVAP